MNRRQTILAALAAALSPAAGKAAPSVDELQRAALLALLRLPDDAAHRVTLIRISARAESDLRSGILDELAEGRPFREIDARVTAAVNENALHTIRRQR